MNKLSSNAEPADSDKHVNDRLQILVNSQTAFISFLRMHVGNEEIAQDILQQGLMRAVEKDLDLQSHENFVAWFYTILRNLIMDHYRNVKTTDRKYQRFMVEQSITQVQSIDLDSEFGKAVCGCVTGLIDLLKPQYAEVIRRIDFDGEDLHEAAEALGISVGNLSVRLYRARQALKKSLVAMCGACAVHKCLDCSCK